MTHMTSARGGRSAGAGGLAAAAALVVAAALLGGASIPARAQVVAGKPAAAAGQAVPAAALPTRLVYGGDNAFPPFEYLDAKGRPQGFNVELMRALAARLGVAVDIRLAPWAETLARFDRGEADLVAMAYTDARAARYAFLPRFWTLSQAVLFRAGRPSYPNRLDLLHNETVATEQDSVMERLFDQLPEVQRPALVLAPDQKSALDLFLGGQVTAVAGNSLTLRYFARQAGVRGLESIPVKSVSYHLVTQKSRAVEMAPVGAALEAFRRSDGVDRLVERLLVIPEERSFWGQYGAFLSIAGGVVLVILAGAFAWNRSLAREVGRRTAELRESENRSRSLIGNMLGGLVTIDQAGRIELVNPAAEEIFGYAEGELIGRHVTSLIPTHVRQRSPDFLRQAFKESIGRVTEWEGVRKNGEVFPLELSFFEFDDPAGRHFAGSVRDISERREVDRLKNEFVSIVSHELRTPLTSIKGSLQLLHHDEVLDAHPEPAQLVRVALSNTERLIRIVNDMLDIAKIEAGRLNLELRRCAVTDLVRTAVQSVDQLARSLSVTLVPGIDAGVPPLRVDADRMVQALVNLLSNAVKVAPPGTEVTISARATAGGEVEIAVRDRGKGIAPDKIPMLFQKFQQLDGSERKVQGTGLGLTITKALVEQHGGRIAVASALGEGTTFTITLPADRG
jgi:PAS domain S-box-containing protein